MYYKLKFIKKTCNKEIKKNKNFLCGDKHKYINSLAIRHPEKINKYHL